MSKFSAGDSLGALAPSEIGDYLTSIGDLDGAAPYIEGAASGQGFLGGTKAYGHTGLMLGFIPPGGSGATSPITGISQIEGDTSLIRKRIKVSLDKFYVHDYPGHGTHNILCEFAGKNQIAGETETLQHALRFKTADKASASLSGVPLFLGVTVGEDGIAFEGRTINVGSDIDETLLATFESPTFQNGLALLKTAQPALKPLSMLAEAAVRNVMKRSKNKQVHCFNLGLDFGAGATSARLRLGSYVVVQTNDAQWIWNDLIWDRDALSLRYVDPNREVAFNYMIIGVSQFSAEQDA